MEYNLSDYIGNDSVILKDYFESRDYDNHLEKHQWILTDKKILHSYQCMGSYYLDITSLKHISHIKVNGSGITCYLDSKSSITILCSNHELALSFLQELSKRII